MSVITIQIASTDNIPNKYLSELLKFTNTVEILGKKGFKNLELSPKTVETLRSAIPQMTEAFESALSAGDLYFEMENTELLFPLSELAWNDRVCSYFIGSTLLTQYVQTVVAAVQRSMKNRFSGYLIFKTNDVESVTKDLHAIALLILNLKKYSWYFTFDSRKSDDFLAHYKHICDIFSKCILIKTDGGYIELTMPYMEHAPPLTPKAYGEYKFTIIDHNNPLIPHLEFVGKTIDSVACTRKTFSDYFNFISKTDECNNCGGYQSISIFSGNFMNNISLNKHFECCNSNCIVEIYGWMKNVKQSYKFIFHIICDALKGKPETYYMTVTDSGHIPLMLSDIEFVISSIDVSKITDKPISKNLLHKIVSENLTFEQGGKVLKLKIPQSNGSLTKMALRDDE